MNIAILGCGYVGTAALLKLKSAHFITAITRSSARQEELGKTAHKASLVAEGDHEDLKQVLKDQDALIVCVAPDHERSYESTYLKTACTIKEALKDRSRPLHIIYTSSTSVYGDSKGKVVDEETPAAPLNHSAQILVDTEQTLLDLEQIQPFVKTCIFRLGEIVGPKRDIKERIKRLAATPGGCVFPGNGSNITNISHIDTIVSAIEFALTNVLSGTFNVCEDLHITRKELYDKICKEEHLPPVIWDATKTSLHSSNKIVSSNKINLLMHHHIPHPLKSGT